MDLRNGETAVDVARNKSRKGDSGKSARSSDSCYLLAGGSRDIYSVTINYKTGHFCTRDATGKACQGNTSGKGRKYGSIRERDTQNENHWCKHVKAVLYNTEQIAEAQDITAVAFNGRDRTIYPSRASQRRMEALKQRARDEMKAWELQSIVATLVATYGKESIKQALKAA